MDGSSKRINVTQDGHLVANFTYSRSTTPKGTFVKFTDTSTGPPTSWAWDFNNDGITDSTVQNPSKSFSRSSSVKLTVSKPGSSDSVTKTVHIMVSPK